MIGILPDQILPEAPPTMIAAGHTFTGNYYGLKKTFFFGVPKLNKPKLFNKINNNF